MSTLGPLFVVVCLLLCAGCGGGAKSWPEPPPDVQQVIRAQGLLRLGAPAQALEAIETFIGEHPDDVWAHRVAQDAMLALGRRDEVLERYGNLRTEQPESAAMAYLMGRILLPDTDAARPQFEASKRLDPTFPWAIVGLSRLEVIRGDMFRAIQLQTEELDALPRDPDLWMNLGFLCLDLQLLRDSQKAFRNSLDARPWDPRTLGGLGQALGQLGQDQEAELFLRRALTNDPSRTDLMGSLAHVLYERGDLEAAWEVINLQQEVDGTANPALVWRLELALQRTLPPVAILGPEYLRNQP